MHAAISMGEEHLSGSFLCGVGWLLIGSLGISLLDALDVFDLLESQLHELLLGEISPVQGGKERLRGDKWRDDVGGLGSSGSGLLLFLVKLLLDHGTQVLELVSKMELLDELVVWLRLRLLKGLLLLVPVGERDQLGGNHLLLVDRNDVEVQEENVRTEGQHILEFHEESMNLWRQGSKR